MKITNQQLKRIIKEEKAKLLKEVYMDKTPDGAKWDEADFTEMQEMMDEL